MKKRYVEIEDEHLKFVGISEDEFEGIALINQTLNNFTHKDIFPWNLIITLSLRELNLNSIPSENEFNKIKAYRVSLEKKFNSTDRPNVLFLAQVCINGKCDLIWRIHEPEIIKEVLSQELVNKSYGFEFGYILTYDNEWLEVGSLIETGMC